jgi:hypothetical protein
LLLPTSSPPFPVLLTGEGGGGGEGAKAFDRKKDDLVLYNSFNPLCCDPFSSSFLPKKSFWNLKAVFALFKYLFIAQIILKCAMFIQNTVFP